MSELVKPIAAWCAAIIEALGIGLITTTALYVLCFAAFQVIKRAEAETIFHNILQRLGRVSLFGLEFLVAADIIHTVAVELTFTTLMDMY